MENPNDHPETLVEFSVLLSKEDYKIVINTIKSKSASHEALATCGDIIVSSARSYC